jgi:hypothetical protein
MSTWPEWELIDPDMEFDDDSVVFCSTCGHTGKRGR